MVDTRPVNRFFVKMTSDARHEMGSNLCLGTASRDEGSILVASTSDTGPRGKEAAPRNTIHTEGASDKAEGVMYETLEVEGKIKTNNLRQNSIYYTQGSLIVSFI